MKQKLQDFVPYGESLKWQIHRNYFMKKGAAAWLCGEVPYDITCNPCAAFQNASLLFEAVRHADSCGNLAGGESVNVIEFASGMGLFAINFIKTFSAICERKNASYADRLVYYFSDFSANNLKDAASNPVLHGLSKSGKIRFAETDACYPAVMRDPFTGGKLPEVKFFAAFANYLHCVLPLTVIRKRDGRLFEKHISLHVRTGDGAQAADGKAAGLNAANADTACAATARMADDPTSEILWPALEETAEYRPIEPTEFFKDMRDFTVIEDMVKYYDVATVIYPHGSFRSIGNFLPLMKPGAVYVISDKGYADFHYMAGESDCAPSLHGNSFAHSVNFPLIEEYAKSMGLKTLRTYDPCYSLQTLVVENPAAADNVNLSRRFRELFIRENPNQDAGDFLTAAADYEKEGQHEKSLRFLKKALIKRPEDAKVLYRLGNASYELGRFDRALDYYTEGAKADYFNQYDFAFCIGQANFCLERYTEAIPYYMRSIGQNKDNPKYAYVNIGLCNNRLGKYCEAEIAFKKALDIDPRYDRALECLEKNCARGRI